MFTTRILTTMASVIPQYIASQIAATELIKDGHVVVHIRTQAQMNAANKL